MGTHNTGFPISPEGLTCDWLTGLLCGVGVVGSGAEVTGLRSRPVGEGAGLMGRVTRVAYTLSGEAEPSGSVIVKSASSSETNRVIAQTFRLYEREVSFYRELAPALEGVVPKCYLAEARSPDEYLIVLEDLGAYRGGDQVAGCGPADARTALDTIARLHATWWGRPRSEMPEWVPRIADDPYRRALVEATRAGWPKALERFGHLISDATRARIPDFVDALPDMYDVMGSGPQTLVHSDFRLDNLLFGDESPGRPLVVVDWSSVQICKGMHDVAFLLSQNLTTEHRRASERDLVEGYHRALVECGVADYGLEECWQDYRYGSMFELMYALVIGGALDIANPRATALVAVLIDRCTKTIADLGLLELIPT